MATTKRHMNIKSAGFTPSGGSLLNLTGSQNVEIDHRGSSVMHSGDDDHFPTTRVVDFEDPMITLTFRDITVLNGVAVGTRGALTFQHLDARYGATAASGGYTATMAGAILTNKTVGAQHRQLGDARATFEGESTDGITNPLGFAAL
jgi:hypothetical protein